MSSTSIDPITGSLSLFPSSFARSPVGFPCGLLSRCREGYGFTVFRAYTISEVGPSFFAGSRDVRDRKSANSCSNYSTFWFKLVSTFSLFLLTTFNGSSHLLPISLYPSAYPPWCWQKHRLLAISMPVW
jgi:hypothetical protein